MKRLLAAASVLATIAFVVPAYAIDIQIGAGNDVDAFVGTPEDVAGNADENPAANPNARINPNAMEVHQIQIRTAAESCVQPADYAGLPCPPTAFAIVDGATLAGDEVLTRDGQRVGVVEQAATSVDGETVFIVDVDSGWLDGFTKLALRLAYAYQSTDGIVIMADNDELKTSLTAAKTAADAAGAAPAAPAPIGTTYQGGAVPTDMAPGGIPMPAPTTVPATPATPATPAAPAPAAPAPAAPATPATPAG